MQKADIRGTNFTNANMDGLDMIGAIVSTTNGTFEKTYTYNGQPVVVAFEYGPTILGNTTPNTACPDGSAGPCSISGS